MEEDGGEPLRICNMQPSTNVIKPATTQCVVTCSHGQGESCIASTRTSEEETRDGQGKGIVHEQPIKSQLGARPGPKRCRNMASIAVARETLTSASPWWVTVSFNAPKYALVGPTASLDLNFWERATSNKMLKMPFSGSANLATYSESKCGSETPCSILHPPLPSSTSVEVETLHVYQRNIHASFRQKPLDQNGFCLSTVQVGC